MTSAYWREQALPSYLEKIERWRAASLADAPDERLLAGVRELALEDARYWFVCALMIARAKVTDALLGRFLTLAAPRRGLTSGMFLRGFPSPTVDAETELEGLAGQVRDSDELRALVTAEPAATLPEALERTPAEPGSPPSRGTLTGTATRSTTWTSSRPRRPMIPCRFC